MPKDTFLNLPDEKRGVIETAAINEFAENGFDNSSINRIVAASGIAKGSFYQYFEDKIDLFNHIIAHIGEVKLEYISPVLLNPTEIDFFTLLTEIYHSGLAFAKDHPKEAQVAFEVYKNSTNPEFKTIIQENRRRGNAFYEKLLDLAITRGEVDPNIELPFITHLLMNLQVAALDYSLENSKLTSWESDIMPTIQMMINFIKNGIRANLKER